MTEKKLIPKPLRGSKSPLFWQIIEFLRLKNSPGKYRHKKIFLLIAFQKSLNSGQKTTDFRRY
jgi:hypothetical protein